MVFKSFNNGASKLFLHVRCTGKTVMGLTNKRIQENLKKIDIV